MFYYEMKRNGKTTYFTSVLPYLKCIMYTPEVLHFKRATCITWTIETFKEQTFPVASLAFTKL